MTKPTILGPIAVPLLCLLSGCHSGVVKGDDAAVYRCAYAATPPFLSADFSAAPWAKARWMALDQKVGSDSDAIQPARAALLWDDVHLYFAADLDDSFIADNFRKRHDPLWEEDCVEFFIDAQGDGKAYYEIEFSPRGTIWDALTLYEMPRRIVSETGWDPASLEVAARKRDGGWCMEGRIRFADMPTAWRIPPLPDDKWRMNVYRCDLAENRTRVFSAWRPTNLFHTPSAYGEIIFDYPERKKETAQRKEAAREMLKGRDLSALRSLSEDIALLKVDSTGGEQFRFDAEKSTWRTEQGFGRFRLAAAERKEFLLPGALHAHPVTGRSATRVTWQVKQPSQLLVFAALTSAAAKTLQTGDGDGSLVRVRMQDGEELGCLRVVDAEPQLMVLDVPAVGTVVLTVEAGAAQNSRYDSTWLGIYEMSLGTADKRR